MRTWGPVDLWRVSEYWGRGGLVVLMMHEDLRTSGSMASFRWLRTRRTGGPNDAWGLEDQGSMASFRWLRTRRTGGPNEAWGLEDQWIYGEFRKTEEDWWSWAESFKHSMVARNRVEIGLSYRPARLHSLVELMPWNRFLGSLKVYSGSDTW